jgi:hypothetical protein
MCEVNDAPHTRTRLIHPPDSTLFHQLLAYLRTKPDPPKQPSGSMIGREGVAATALVLRRGSYLAVLLDRNKPLWCEVHSAATSRISDEEMARINIEASAALAEWIDIYRADPGGREYEQLVNRAVSYLPMPKKTSKLIDHVFAAPADPNIAALFIEHCDSPWLERIRTEAARFSSRIFANALVNTAWRNGPVEDIHAGEFQGYPLDKRRVTPAEERTLMAFAGDRLAVGLNVLLRFAREQPARPWPEQVLPYSLAGMLLITPSHWTLTESSRKVRLAVGLDRQSSSV